MFLNVKKFVKKVFGVFKKDVNEMGYVFSGMDGHWIKQQDVLDYQVCEF